MFDHELLKLLLPQVFAYLTSITLFLLTLHKESKQKYRETLEKRISNWYIKFFGLYAIGLGRQTNWLNIPPESREQILNLMYSSIQYMSTYEQEQVMILSDLTKKFEIKPTTELSVKCNNTFLQLCVMAQSQHNQICRLLKLPQPASLIEPSLLQCQPHKTE